MFFLTYVSILYTTLDVYRVITRDIFVLFLLSFGLVAIVRLVYYL